MPRKRGSKPEKLKPLLHIFCEGEKTEPNYFKGYIGTYFPGTRLLLVQKTDKNTPIQLVEIAIATKKHSPPGDLFWVVFDREGAHKYSDAQHNEARAKAVANGIQIAHSNVCFEVWILLHFQKTVAAYSSYSDLRKRSKLTAHIKRYDKGAKRIFSDSEIRAARQNARSLNKRTKNGANPSWTQPHQWNPYTDVYELLDAIDLFGAQFACK
ncbi:MAG: RloB family protein [Verrucomicrobia bacterium]|nr:RloB family protein [Verrucomicrobiota bacterium]